jgi:hypothetical protein
LLAHDCVGNGAPTLIAGARRSRTIVNEMIDYQRID